MLEKIFNPNFIKNKKENDKEKKEELVLKIIVSRHGPKLSAEGEKNEQAEYFKKMLLKDLILWI
jgi:hypothetical protein